MFLQSYGPGPYTPEQQQKINQLSVMFQKVKEEPGKVNILTCSLLLYSVAFNGAIMGSTGVGDHFPNPKNIVST